MFKNKEEYRYFAFTTDINMPKLDLPNQKTIEMCDNCVSFNIRSFKRLKSMIGIITQRHEDNLKNGLKSIYTLIGTCNEYDHFKNLGENTFHKWKREKVYNWFKAGKIKFIVESNKLDWYE